MDMADASWDVSAFFFGFYSTLIADPPWGLFRCLFMFGLVADAWG